MQNALSNKISPASASREYYVKGFEYIWIYCFLNTYNHQKKCWKLYDDFHFLITLEALKNSKKKQAGDRKSDSF